MEAKQEDAGGSVQDAQFGRRAVGGSGRRVEQGEKGQQAREAGPSAGRHFAPGSDGGEAKYRCGGQGPQGVAAKFVVP